MANAKNQKKSALLDWKNEKKYQEQIVKQGKAPKATIDRAKARIKEADAMISKLSK